jgi:hypothetical protein
MLQVPDAPGRLMTYLAVGGSQPPPLGPSGVDKVGLFARQFGRSCRVQHGNGRNTIVWITREESHPRVDLALIFLEGQERSSVGETCLVF